MKRLGVYGFISIVLISIIGGLVAPEKATAAISQTDFTAQKNLAFSANVEPFFGITGAADDQKQAIFERVRSTLEASAVEVFNKIKDNPQTTPTSARLSLLTRWDTDLFGIESSLSLIEKARNAEVSISNARASIAAAQQQAAVSFQLENNKITQINANAERANIAANQTAAISKNLASNNPSQCSLLNGNLLGCIDQLITFVVKNTLLQLAGFLAWLASSLLNYAIQISILDFSKWAPDSLYALWIIVRQIISLIVVFSGLYLGFMYIIGREDTFGKYIGWLVIFALFVNFSYPITRALVDVSNIISLNVYSSAVGPETLAGSTGNTAGGLILDKLGLQGLIASATGIKSQQAGFIADINSTPGALLAVVFVAYAAWVFFIATMIIASRTAILVFLIVASPILLVDAVVPKLGDVAVKMRKIFVEQLIAAPVFMIMLALTLKFMDVFQKGGVLGASTEAALKVSGSGDTIKTFFGILMMLIMLHIMLKVTKSVAGSAGLAATNMIGKVGGFGLGVASGGAGFLARGSVGLAAARMRDSDRMDKMQGSRLGRGLYSLTNSLAQSTYDTRNVGLVSKGMASAGMGMGQGLKQNYDQRFSAKEEAMKAKYGSIRDSKTRQDYLKSKTGGVGSMTQRGILLGSAKSDNQLIAEKIAKEKKTLKAKYDAIENPVDKRKFYLDHQDALDRLDKENTSPAPTLTSTQAEILAETTRTSPTSDIPMGATIDAAHPGGSDFTHLDQTAHPAPAEGRTQTEARTMTPEEIVAINKKLEETRAQAAQTEPPLAQSQATLANIKTQSVAEIAAATRKAKLEAAQKKIEGGDTSSPKPPTTNPSDTAVAA